MASSSLSSSLLFFPPKLPISSSFFSKPISVRPPFFILSSPISFQSLSNSNSREPIIKSQLQSQSQPQFQSQSESLPPKLQQIVTLFQSVADPKSKYQQLLHYGTQLPPYPSEFKTDDYRVRGCVSQVWVRACPDSNDPSKVRFDADSDSSLTKGLAALLVFGLSGESPTVVCGVSPEFATLLGLKQSLTPSRNNGFLNMLRLMQEKAADIGGLGVGGQDGILKEEMENLRENNRGFEGHLENVEVLDANGKEIGDLGGSNGGFEGSLESEEVLDANGEEIDGLDQDSNGGLIGGRKERIRERLEKELKPIELKVEDVSHLHAGHAGVRGNSSGETHFNLRVVSKEFEGKSMVKRHRLIYDLLREELESGLHALSIIAKTPSEV